MESERARQAGGGLQPEGGQRHHQGSQLYQGPAVRQSYPMMCRYIDEGVVESGMGLFQIVGHWPKILPKTQKGPAECGYSVCVLCMVYSFPPLRLKFMLDWPAISVSS